MWFDRRLLYIELALTYMYNVQYFIADHVHVLVNSYNNNITINIYSMNTNKTFCTVTTCNIELNELY